LDALRRFPMRKASVAGVCGMSAMAPRQGYGGAALASVGRRQQRIVVGRASVAPSHALAAALAVACQRNYHGGGVVGAMGGGSISMGRRWRKGTINRGW
jgi:hypothetical protein